MLYTREELEMILDNHRKWLERKEGGVRADLRGADLREADLCGADLRGAKEIPFIPQACPDTGSFIAWKKS